MSPKTTGMVGGNSNPLVLQPQQRRPACIHNNPRTRRKPGARSIHRFFRFRSDHSGMV